VLLSPKLGTSPTGALLRQIIPATAEIKKTPTLKPPAA